MTLRKWDSLDNTDVTLGDRFLAELDVVVDRIGDAPLRFPTQNPCNHKRPFPVDLFEVAQREGQGHPSLPAMFTFCGNSDICKAGLPESAGGSGGRCGVRTTEVRTTDGRPWMPC